MMFRKLRLLFAIHTGAGRRLARGNQTDVPAEVIPHEVKALLDDLRRRGYSVIQTNYYETVFGDAIIVLERDTTQIRLSCDRGPWFIEVRSRRLTWTRPGWFGASSDWYSPKIWRAFLEASTPPVEIVPFGVQARWLLEDLSRIEASSGPTKKQLVDGRLEM